MENDLIQTNYGKMNLALIEFLINQYGMSAKAGLFF